MELEDTLERAFRVVEIGDSPASPVIDRPVNIDGPICPLDTIQRGGITAH